MTTLTPLTFLLIIISPAIGSFIGVLIDRLPRDEDVIVKGSTCRNCSTVLRPMQMIPLFSFMMQRGACGTCGQPIPAWLFYTELLALCAAVLAVIAGGDPAHVFLSALFLWVLIGLAGADLLWFRLPDVLTATLAVVAVGLAVAPGGIGLYDAMLGAFFGAGSFAVLRGGYFWLRGREGLGLGDVKLMVGLGAFSGPFDLPMLILLGAVLGLLIAVMDKLRNRSALKADGAIPFGTALCGAAGLLWLVN
ncbi:MAG: A24 family peptidase [Sulfitobacter sp.]